MVTASPLGRVLAGANCHDSPLLAPTLHLLNDLGPLPDAITVHLDTGYDSAKTRAVLDERGLRGQIAHKGEKAPLQATQRWHVERTHAWQNAFHRLARCYERRLHVINAFFDLADAVITVRSLIRRAWTTHRWDNRPTRRPCCPIRAASYSRGGTSMVHLSALHDGALPAGGAALLYSATITVSALVAVLAPTPARRRAARDVLGILLRRPLMLRRNRRRERRAGPGR